MNAKRLLALLLAALLVLSMAACASGTPADSKDTPKTDESAATVDADPARVCADVGRRGLGPASVEPVVLRRAFLGRPAAASVCHAEKRYSLPCGVLGAPPRV